MYDLSILYAEDDIKLQQQYVKLLKTLFKKVYTASDGEEAWELYNTRKPNIILVDIDMPKLDGLMLTQRIREIDTVTKVIILTAYYDRENLHKAIPLQLVNFLVKPIKVYTLLEELETIAKKLLQIVPATINDIYSYCFGTKRLFENSQTIPLTKNEIKLIELFLETEQIVVETQIIFDTIWDDFDYSMTKLRSLINRFNSKLSNKLIVSHYALGYKLNK